jgi:cell wall-associated NlpC family hydrolase
VVARARGCLGARFRLHGRDPATGLDCVGLVAVALGRGDAPTGYRLRSGSAGEYSAMLAAAGLTIAATARPGDVLLCASGPGQFHLGIASGAGTIHADAGLGRVVERPGATPWPVVSVWRSFDTPLRLRSAATQDEREGI